MRLSPKRNVAVIVLIIGAAAFGLVGCGKTKASNTGATTTTLSSKSSTTSKGSGSLKSLNAIKASGSPQHCSVTIALLGNATGDFWTDGKGNTRATYSLSQAGKSFATNVIVKDNFMYMWIDTGQGAVVGYKIDLSNKNIDASKYKNIGGLDPNSELSANCDSWTVDSSKFDQPSGVTFTDYTSLMASISASTIPDNTPTTL